MCDVMCDTAMLEAAMLDAEAEAEDDVHGTVYPQWIDWLDVD